MAAVKGWIGVDLDATLAFYDGWKGIDHIGAPIPAMVARIHAWLAENSLTVKIFTARVSHDGTPQRMAEAEVAREAIRLWCLKHIGVELEITNVKDFAMVATWDDRAIQVVPNTGEPVVRP